MGTHLLTGAGSGIGAAVAERLHARGDRPFLLARDEQRATDLAEAFPGVEVLVADLADPTAIERLAPSLPAALDSVVHAAGVVDLGPVADLESDVLVHHLDVNLVAPAVLTRLCLPALRRARGSVVLVNSGQGLHAAAGWGAYAMSKFGLRAFADALRAEESGHGVRVTSVYPGRTATAMQERVHAQEGAAYDASRWTRPATVADTVVHCLDLPADATIPDVTVRPGP